MRLGSGTPRRTRSIRRVHGSRDRQLSTAASPTSRTAATSARIRSYLVNARVLNLGIARHGHRGRHIDGDQRGAGLRATTRTAPRPVSSSTCRGSGVLATTRTPTATASRRSSSTGRQRVPGASIEWRLQVHVGRARSPGTGHSRIGRSTGSRSRTRDRDDHSVRRRRRPRRQHRHRHRRRRHADAGPDTDPGADRNTGTHPGAHAATDRRARRRDRRCRCRPCRSRPLAPAAPCRSRRCPSRRFPHADPDDGHRPDPDADGPRYRAQRGTRSRPARPVVAPPPPRHRALRRDRHPRPRERGAGRRRRWCGGRRRLERRRPSAARAAARRVTGSRSRCTNRPGSRTPST